MDGRGLGLLVGIDGSEGGDRALDWAARAAAAQDSSITVAYVISGFGPSDLPTTAGLRNLDLRAAQAIVDTGVQRAGQATPGLPVTGRRVEGDPATELITLSADADQVVLGSRGHGGFASLLVGSVATKVAGHAACPVVVVRDDAHPTGPVVIGIDGSDRGEAALRYGFSYADRHRLPVRGLHVYHVDPPMARYLTEAAGAEVAGTELAGTDAAGAEATAAEAARRSSEQLVGARLRSWQEKYPDVVVEAETDIGSPARHLVDLSTTASLLVVGHRGHGRLAGLVLGSVSQAVLTHAHCPVVITR
ncbi:MAG TPA: universal stress protein [Mycobacteriales bacterium]